MSGVLLVVGHKNIAQITPDGLCPGRDAGALSRETGAAGEMVWNQQVADALAPLLMARGFAVTVTDAVFHPELYVQDWDLVLSIHAQRDAPTHRAFASAPNPAGGYIGPSAQAISERWVVAFNQPNGAWVVPATPQFVSANMTDYYGWCYVTTKTPCVIVETKNLDVDAAASADQVAAWLRDVTAQTIQSSPPPPPPPPPVPGPVRLAALGPTRVTRQRALGALWSVNPTGSVAVIDAYLELAPLFGIPAEAVIAQALKESSYLQFGRIARPEWHNYAGLGCSEITRTCNVFPTIEAGVRAHLGHWLCYFGDHFLPFCAYDQRHFGANSFLFSGGPLVKGTDATGHLHLPNDVDQLSGRWAPALDYADGIVRLALEMVG